MREVRCKTVLHRLGYGSKAEYTANFYKGCSHGCVYCYVPSLVHDERRWGRFVDAKVNAPEVLGRELLRATKAPVFLSSATDPYQPVEARYGITRRCLELLSRNGFPVILLTRSPLVLRDIEILKRFEWARVGFSISTVRGRFYEPGVPPLERRLECLEALRRHGVKTWVSLAPIVPGVLEVDLEDLIQRLREAGVSAVAPGLLRFQYYEESGKMFEESTGLDRDQVLKGGEEVLREVKRLLAHGGFEEPETALQWSPKEVSLDSFATA